MSAKEIKEIINKLSGYDIGVKSRKRDLVGLKSVYCKVCRDFGGGKTRQLTYNEIGSEINLNHATAMHHCNNTFIYFYKENKKIREIYNYFSNGNIENVSDDVYKVKYLDLLNEYNKLKVRNYDNEILDLIKNIPNEMIPTLKTRLKPIVKMLCNAKFN